MEVNTQIYKELICESLSYDSKTLPVAIPLITTHQNRAYPLSVIATDDRCKGWFYSNFINIMGAKNYRFEWTKDCELHNSLYHYIEFFGGFVPRDIIIMDYNILTKRIVETFNIDIIEFSINAIKENYYINTYIDDFYIPFNENYNKKHHHHDIFIYGFNKSEKTFSCLSFGDDLKFSSRKLSFEKFFLSFKSKEYTVDVPENEFDISPYFLFKVKDYIDFKFDVDYIFTAISDYLLSLNPYRNLKGLRNTINERNYGVSVYSNVCEGLKYLISHDDLEIDLRSFSVLMEHKECMLKRLKYLQELNVLKNSEEILNEYGEVVKKATSLRNVVLKNKAINLFDYPSLIGKVLELKDSEVFVLKKISRIML